MWLRKKFIFDVVVILLLIWVSVLGYLLFISFNFDGSGRLFIFVIVGFLNVMFMILFLY